MQGDIIANFENIAGSEFDDTLTGDAGINIIHGYGGNDLSPQQRVLISRW